MAQPPRRIGVGTVALVTGAASGIGAAIARALAAKGAKVCCADINLAGASAVAHGTNGLALGLDVSDPAMWANAFDVAQSAYGPVNLLVSNAGVLVSDWALDQTDKAIAAMVNVNVMGTIYGVRTGLSRMGASGGGRIVTIGSMASYIPLAGQAVYAASKHAVRAYHQGIAAECGNGPVKFTLVTPGAVATPMIEAERGKDAAALSFAAKAVSANEVAAALIWASDRNMDEICVPSGGATLAKIMGVFPKQARALVARARTAGQARLAPKA